MLTLLESVEAQVAGAIKDVGESGLFAAILSRLDPNLRAVAALGTAFLAGIGSFAGLQAWVVALPDTVEGHEVRIALLEMEQSALLVSILDTSEQLETVICILEAQTTAMGQGLQPFETLDSCRPALFRR